MDVCRLKGLDVDLMAYLHICNNHSIIMQLIELQRFITCSTGDIKKMSSDCMNVINKPRSSKSNAFTVTYFCISDDINYVEFWQ